MLFLFDTVQFAPCTSSISLTAHMECFIKINTLVRLLKSLDIENTMSLNVKLLEQLMTA